jgi:hypothetical protein
MRTAIDALVVYPFLLLRGDQPRSGAAAAWQRPPGAD